MKLKSLLFICLLFLLSPSYAQKEHKTKNVIVVLMDGYRWQEPFKGEIRLYYLAKNITRRIRYGGYKKVLGADEKERREKLMPFV